VSTEPEKTAWLVGAVADGCKPTETDADRMVFLAGRPQGPLTRRVTMSCAGEP
jgi:hypothetical protein